MLILHSSENQKVVLDNAMLRYSAVLNLKTIIMGLGKCHCLQKKKTAIAVWVSRRIKAPEGRFYGEAALPPTPTSCPFETEETP